jgi:hypothetical protein
VTTAAAETTPAYRPAFPPGRAQGVGIVGCGGIAKTWHLPAYGAYGVNVVGVYDPDPTATDGIRERFPFVRDVFASLDDLLADPELLVVDIATRPEVRVDLIRRAVEAGKHVLAQKPLADDLRAAREVVEEAERRGVKVAVNQNGRWSPPWRIATLLIADGAIGDVVAVTHLLDKPLPPLVGTHFDELEHFTIYDYCVHWIDICRCWLDGKTVAAVRAHEYRPPQPTARDEGAVGGVDRDLVRGRVERARPLRRGREDDARGVPVLGARDRGDDPRKRAARLRLRRARAERGDVALHARGRVVSGRLRRHPRRARERRGRGPRAVQLRAAQPALPPDRAGGVPVGRGGRAAGRAGGDPVVSRPGVDACK